MMFFSGVVAGVVLLSTTTVSSYPISPGTCGAGPAIAVESAGNHGPEGSGDIFLEGISLELSGLFMIPFAPTTMPIGQEIPLRIAAPIFNDVVFRGFLYRISADDGVTDVSNVIQLPAEELAKDEEDRLIRKLANGVETLTVPPICAQNVAGVGHALNLDKKEITIPFLYNGPDIDLTLETTVVLSNTGGGQNSWVYTSFPIKLRRTGYCTGLSTTSVKSACDFSIPDVPGGVTDIVKRGEAYFTEDLLSSNYFAVSNTPEPTLYEIDIKINKSGKKCSGEVVRSCTFGPDYPNLKSIVLTRAGNFFISSEGSDGDVEPFVSTFNEFCEEVIDDGGAFPGMRYRFPEWFEFGGASEPLPNKNFESASVSPNTILHNIAMEAPLTGDADRYSRVLGVDNIWLRNVQAEYVYVLDETPNKYAANGLTGWLLMDDMGSALALERASGGPNSKPISLRLYQTDLFTSVFVNRTAALKVGEFPPEYGMDKRLLADLGEVFGGALPNIEAMAIVDSTFGDKGGRILLASNEDKPGDAGRFYVFDLAMEERTTVGARAVGLEKEVKRFGLGAKPEKFAKKIRTFATKPKVQQKKVEKQVKKFRKSIKKCTDEGEPLCFRADFLANLVVTCFLTQDGLPFILPEGVGIEDTIPEDGPP